MNGSLMKLMRRINWALIKQFLQYGTVGMMALGVDVGTFTVVRALGLDLVPANVLARLTGAVAAYTGNFLWTFRQTRHMVGWLHSSWRYAALWVGVTLVSTLLLCVLTRLGLNETYCKLGVEMTMPFLNFVLARLWVFRAAKQPVQ